MQHINTTTGTKVSDNRVSYDDALRRRVAEQSVEGLPPRESVRRWRETAVLLSVGFVGVAGGAIGFSLMGPYGAAVASVLVLGCLLAASPVLGAALARRRDELEAVRAS
ncbi:MAG: hypothetical protein AAFS11_07485 [Planctomycetota bacterium]